MLQVYFEHTSWKRTFRTHNVDVADQELWSLHLDTDLLHHVLLDKEAAHGTYHSVRAAVSRSLNRPLRYCAYSSRCTRCTSHVAFCSSRVSITLYVVNVTPRAARRIPPRAACIVHRARPAVHACGESPASYGGLPLDRRPMERMRAACLALQAAPSWCSRAVAGASGGCSSWSPPSRPRRGRRRDSVGERGGIQRPARHRCWGSRGLPSRGIPQLHNSQLPTVARYPMRHSIPRRHCTRRGTSFALWYPTAARFLAATWYPLGWV
jgi:hypothetical protein